ncbi:MULTISPECIES: hypothetical protein [Microbacterium]|uniref:PIN domain-containing protein n=1 Tax=Microbacterium profundi TaxID=450380 RepID=A0ABV3LFW1_9MICO|nr:MULTISPECIES: hypothetical protein [Microbacterium]MCE7482274.1 hypothetical protein [Microbacterium profundi]
MAAYLDTSAAAKLVLSEEHSDDLFDEIMIDQERVLVASWLLHTELHGAVARRRGEIITYDAELADAARGAGLRVMNPGV